MRKLIGNWVVGGLLCLLAREAGASGIGSARFGGEQGHAATSNTTAVYYNPAALTLTTGSRAYVDSVLMYRRQRYTRPADAIDNPLDAGAVGAGTPAEAVTANSGTATLGHPMTSPFVGAALDLNRANIPGLTVGVGVYFPFGGMSMWDRNAGYEGSAYYGAEDGVQRWWSIEGTIRSTYVTGAVAYRLPSVPLGFGVGLNLVNTEVNTIRARNANATDDLVDGTGTSSEGRSVIDVSGWDPAIGLGVVWLPRPELVLGVSYQSMPGFGEMTLDGTVEGRFGLAGASTSAVEMRQKLPDIVRWAARWRPSPRTEVRVFGDLSRWSVVDRQCVLDASVADRACVLTESGAVDDVAGGAGVILNIPRAWKDAVAVRASGSYWIKPRLEVLAGAGYDGNAIPDSTLEPSIIDQDKVSASVGARWDLPRIAVQATLTQVVYLDREIDPRATTPSPPSRSPDPAGTYEQSLSIFQLSAEYRF